MNSFKTFLLWTLPVLLPLSAIHAWEYYQFITPPPVLSPKDESGQHIPVSKFELISQSGKSWNYEQLEGKFHVVNFFFISCPDVCPRMNNQMKALYDRFENYESFSLLSISVNPEQDTPDKLSSYARSLEVTEPGWTFLTGEKRKIYSIARNEFNVSAAEGDGGMTGFIHSELLILLDNKGLIRGYYDSGDNGEMKRLNKDIELILQQI